MSQWPCVYFSTGVQCTRCFIGCFRGLLVVFQPLQPPLLNLPLTQPDHTCMCKYVNILMCHACIYIFTFVLTFIFTFICIFAFIFVNKYIISTSKQGCIYVIVYSSNLLNYWLIFKIFIYPFIFIDLSLSLFLQGSTACKVHVADIQDGSQPASTPGPGHDHGVDEAGHQEGKHRLVNRGRRTWCPKR